MSVFYLSKLLTKNSDAANHNEKDVTKKFENRTIKLYKISVEKISPKAVSKCYMVFITYSINVHAIKNEILSRA